MTKLVRSRWLEIGQVLFLRVNGRNEVEVHKKRPRSRYLERTSLSNKGVWHSTPSCRFVFFSSVFAGFVAIYNVFLKLINIFVFFVVNVSGFLVFGFHPDRNHRKCFYCHGKHFAKENFCYLALPGRNCFILGNETGNLERAVSLHLARSGTQSELRIRRIFPSRGAWQFAR